MNYSQTSLVCIIDLKAIEGRCLSNSCSIRCIHGIFTELERMKIPEKSQEILVRLERCAVQIMCMTTNIEADYEYDVY